MAMGIQKIASIGVVAFGVLALPSLAMAGDRDDGARGGRGDRVEGRSAGSMDPAIAAFRKRVRAREAAERTHARASGGEAQERRSSERRRAEPVRTAHATPRAGEARRETRIDHPARVEAARPVTRTSDGAARARDIRPAAPIGEAARVGADRPVARTAYGYGSPHGGYDGPRFGYGPRMPHVGYGYPPFGYRVRVIHVGYGFRRFGYGPRVVRFGYGFHRFGYGRRFAFVR